MSKEIFAKRLVELRENNGVSQAELAKHLGVTRQSLSLYETAERTINIDLLEQIAEYFNVSADYLLGISSAYSPNIEIQAICKKIGCSEDVVDEFEEMYALGIAEPEIFPPPSFLDTVFSADLYSGNFGSEFRGIIKQLFHHVMMLIEVEETVPGLRLNKEDYELLESLKDQEKRFEFLASKEKPFHELYNRRDASEWRLMKGFSEFAEALADKYIKKQVK